MDNLINNKTIDYKELKRFLELKFGSETYFESEDEICCHIDNYIQDTIELPLFHEVVELLGESAVNNIYELVDNADELRDTQHDFTKKLAEKLFN